jgi:hypothetical protein
VNSSVENITDNGELLAIIVRSGFQPRGIEFVTPDYFSQQLGFMDRPAGYEIQPHIHLAVERATTITQEVLYIKNGKVRVDFYRADETFVCSSIVSTGDVLLLSAGGHGFQMLERSEIIEIKQGPYLEDKRRFNPAPRNK